MKNRKSADSISCGYNGFDFHDCDEKEVQLYKLKVMIKKIIFFVVSVSIIGTIAYFYVVSNDAIAQPTLSAREKETYQSNK